MVVIIYPKNREESENTITLQFITHRMTKSVLDYDICMSGRVLFTCDANLCDFKRDSLFKKKSDERKRKGSN